MNDEHAGPRDLIERLFQASLAAVEPRAAVQRALTLRGHTLLIEGRQTPVAGRVAAVAIGKAAPRMAQGALDVLGDAIAEGIILTKDGHLGDGVPGFAGYEASHPVPDERGVAATQEILALARTLGRGDVLLALISGGGSALLEAARYPVTLADLQRTTELLLRAGAPIQDLNAVRSELSLVKGGGLRVAAGEAACCSIVLSDVLGNDPTVIASGPTVVRRANAAAALAILERYGLRDDIPETVRASLDSPAPETVEPPPQGDSEIDRWVVIGDNNALIAAAASWLDARSLQSQVVWNAKQGEARTLAREWVERCSASNGDVEVLLGGGEATVTVRGSGRGGRNTEFALAAAIELAAKGSDWTIASLASDGDDGAADAAGAIVDGSTVARMRRLGIDPADALDRNDSATALGAVGALVRLGPTGTNVNDLYVAVRAGTVGEDTR